VPARKKKTTRKTSRKATIEFADITLRDGHQSQWGTMMLIDDLLALAPYLAQVGFASYEVFGGATTHTAILKKGENPFMNLEKLREVMPKALFSMLLRGQNGVGYMYYPDDVIRHFIQQAAEFERMRATYEGVNIFRIFDAHNYLPNIRIAMEEVIALNKAGKNVHAQGAICFSISENPYVDVEDLVQIGHQMAKMGAHSLCVKDMAGRAVPEQADALIRGLAKTGLPIAWHSHTTFGSHAATLAAMRAAISSKARLTVDTCLFGLSGGYSHIDAEALIHAMNQDKVLKNHIPDINLEALHEAQAALLKIVGKYTSYELSHDPDMIKAMKKAQVPGGMITNLMRNVSDQTGLSTSDDGFRSVLMHAIEEFAAVREDVGYPSVVTPSSQYVGTQAVFNVMEMRRVEQALAKVKADMGSAAYEAGLKSALEEARYTGTMVPTFAEMVLGHHGRLPGPVKNRILDLARKKTKLKRIKYTGENIGEESYRAAENLQPGLAAAEQILHNHGIDPLTPDGQKMLALAAQFPNDFDKVVVPVDPRKEMQPYPHIVELPRVSDNECAAIGDVVDVVGGQGVVHELIRRLCELTRLKDGTYEGLRDSSFVEFETDKISARWKHIMQKLNDTYHGALWVGVCSALKEHIKKEIKKKGIDESIFQDLVKRFGKPGQENSA
jgi:pyruvate/oxaloacetate carboxyltransferase